MIFTFSYSFGQNTYQMQPGQIATGLIDVSVEALAGWWGPTAPLNGPALCEFPAGDLSQRCDLQLFDASGQPILGNMAPFINGRWRGKIAFRPLGASMQGGEFLDVSIKFTDLSSGQGGGSGSVLRIKLASPAPVTKHKWVAANNGVPFGSIDIPEGQENVTLTRDTGLMFPASIFR